MYAPTVTSSSVRLLAALACELDLELCHFDIDQAFVSADLAEDVYMRLPEGRHVKWLRSAATSTTTTVSEDLHLHRNTMKNATSNNNDYSYDERRTVGRIFE